MAIRSVCRPLSPFSGFHAHQADKHYPMLHGAIVVAVPVTHSIVADDMRMPIIADQISTHEPSLDPERELVSRVISGDDTARNWFAIRCFQLVQNQLKATCIAPERSEEIGNQVTSQLFEHDYQRLRTWFISGRRRLVSLVKAILRKAILDWGTTAVQRPVTVAKDEFHKLCGTDNLWRSTLPEILNGTVGTGALCRIASRQQKRAAMRSISMLLRRDSEILRRSYLQGETADEVCISMELAPSGYNNSLMVAERRLKTKLCNSCPNLFV